MGDIAEAFEEIKRRTLVGLPISDPIGSRNWANAMQVYNARIVQIARSAREAVAFLQSKRNTFVSLFRLPPEVLCEIILCLNMKGRLRVSWTSSHLRQISLASPSIWADLDFSWSSSRLLRCLLERAANAPLTVRQGTALRINPMRSIARPTRYTKYESVDHCRGSPLEWELSTLLARTTTLDLSSSFAMSTSPLELISPGCFDLPMPFLVTLRLRALTGPKNQKHWFTGMTPRLRHIFFHRLAAPWDDPIYKNLVSLALHYPYVPISPVELAKILSRSPMLEELVLQGALEGATEEPQQLVDLPHLQRLHLEINRSGFDRDGGSRTMRLFLSLIRPGPHCKLYIETNDLGAFPSPIPEGSFSHALQHTDTLRIAAVWNRIELHVCRDLDVFWSYVATVETTHLGGFDAPDFRSPAMLAALLYMADTARIPWDKILTLSVAISDRALESRVAHVLGPGRPKPPYHNFFARLFRKCVNIRGLSLSTTNPTSILVNALSTGCRTLKELSVDGNIKDPTLLSLWVQERCSIPQQCAKITKLLVKHRSGPEGLETSFAEYEKLRSDLLEYEELRDDAKARFASIVPEFEWKDLQSEHHETVTWQDPWGDVEFII